METTCTIHNVIYTRYTKEGKPTWYSHKNNDGTWCHMDKKKAAQIEAARAQIPSITQPASNLPPKPPQPPPQPVQAKTSPVTTPTPQMIPPVSKNVAFALSYSKDLVMNMQLPINLMFGCAEAMRTYMDGELKVDTAPYRDWIIKQDEKAKEVNKPKRIEKL